MEIETEAVVKTVTKPSRSKRSGGRSWRASRTETEEEATIRRYHDAQRMARFRARRKKALEEQLQAQQQQGEVRRLSSSVSGQDESDPERQQAPISSPVPSSRPQQQQQQQQSPRDLSSTETESKYVQLLAIIERLGRDVRLSYAGSRSSAERLKSGIGRARILVRDCLIETRLNLRQ